MTAPFRDDVTASDARVAQLLEEIEELRERLGAYDGENRDVVVANQLERLRGDIEDLRAARAELRQELAPQE